MLSASTARPSLAISPDAGSPTLSLVPRPPPPDRRLLPAVRPVLPALRVPFCLLISGHRRTNKISAMQDSKSVASKEMLFQIDATTVEEYVSQSKLLKDFANIPNIDKAWIFKSDDGNSSRAMFSIGQSNLFANKKRTLILSTHISKTSEHSVNFQWSPFPIEMIGVSAVVPSPSGSRLLVVRTNAQDNSTQLEIWGSSYLEKEIHISKSVHGPLFTDGWFEGISWHHEENLIAYVAEEPSPIKPTFNDSGFISEGVSEDCDSWKGQGDWEEDWGETYSKRRKPSLFVVNINSSEVRAVDGIPKSLSVGQVIWAPSSPTVCREYLVFVAWSSENGPNQTARKLGIKYCYNRPCALYLVCAPFQGSCAHKLPSNNYKLEDCVPAVNITHGISSAFFPRFSPDGRFLVFLSAKSAVDSGVHSATNSLHKIDWPINGKPYQSADILDVVPVVMFAEDGCFPGLYCSSFLFWPWLSDGHTIILTSVWGSTQVILSVNILSREVSRISPSDSDNSWNVLALDGDNILAVSSSPIDPPQVKYGYNIIHEEKKITWNWMEVKSLLSPYSEKAKTLLASHKFRILKIPVPCPCDDLPEGAKKPFEGILISSSSLKDESSNDSQKAGASNPLIVFLHGGPHTVSVSSFSKSLAFLSCLGFNMLIVNYRGSLGFGEEALQSLPGRIGSQDVSDVLAALDYVNGKGFADASKVAVVGGSHGGFLTTHLIGQAPDRFAAAAVRNPACNISLMAGTSDIPDWCYVESLGRGGKKFISEAPLMEHLSVFYSKSPISHVKMVKVPTLFLLGAQDLRVPISNGLQYARALREKGCKVKVIMFPDDDHGLERPQSDYESFLNIGVWFRKYCK